MANFAVNASDEVIAQGRDLLEKLAQPGEKQGDVLGRIFSIVSSQTDGETMKQGGVDVQALDSSLSNIRTMFLASVTGKEQIVAEKDARIAEIKALKDKQEADLRGQLDVANEAREQAEAVAEAAEKAAAQAVKDADAAKEQADTANNLAAEKDKTISTLAEKLAAAEEKASGYDDLKQKEADAQEEIKELNRTIAANKTAADREAKDMQTEYEHKLAAAARELEAAQKAAERDLEDEKASSARALSDAEKDKETEIRELTAKMERTVSDTQKDAALATAQAVADKEREMTKQLRESDKENARLQERIKTLEARIQELTKKD